MTNKCLSTFIVAGFLGLPASSPAVITNHVEKTIQITSGSAIETNPSIDGDIIAWQDYRSGHAEIYGYNLASQLEFPIAVGGIEKAWPQVSGKYVIWHEVSTPSNRALYVKNLQTGITRTIASGLAYVDEYYSIVNDTVYYAAAVDGSQPLNTIFSYDLGTSATHILASSPNGYRIPNADGHYLTWQSGISNEVIYMDLQTQLITKATAPGRWGEPTIGGNFIAAQSGSNFDSQTIQIYDLNLHTFTAVEPTPGKNFHPSADGNFVVWVNGESLPGRLSGYDVLTGEKFDIISDPVVLHTQRAMEISDNRIAWAKVSPDFSRSDIYVTVLVPEPPTIISAMIAVGTVLWIALRRKARRNWKMAIE